MATAQIVIDQTGHPTQVGGIPGRSRDDIVRNLAVTLRNLDDTGVRSHRWSIEDQPNVATPVGLSNPILAAPEFTPDSFGTYRVKLIVNEGRNRGEIAELDVAIRTPGGLRIPASGERAEANWLDESGSPNPRGWQPDLRKFLERGLVPALGSQVIQDWTGEGDAVATRVEGWTEVLGDGGAVALAEGDNRHPGLLRLSITAAANSRAAQRRVVTAHRVGGGELQYEALTKLDIIPGGGNDFEVRMGFMTEETLLAEPADGVYFQREEATNEWLAKTAKASSVTSVATGVVGTATVFQRFTIVVNSDASEVVYFIDDVEVARITTDIPADTSDMASFLQIVRQGASGGVVVMENDYVRIFKAIDPPR